jgi:hypothetical protein
MGHDFVIFVSLVNMSEVRVIVKQEPFKGQTHTVLRIDIFIISVTSYASGMLRKINRKKHL